MIKLNLKKLFDEEYLTSLQETEKIIIEQFISWYQYIGIIPEYGRVLTINNNIFTIEWAITDNHGCNKFYIRKLPIGCLLLEL